MLFNETIAERAIFDTVSAVSADGAYSMDSLDSLDTLLVFFVIPARVYHQHC